jgi:spore germination protein
MGIPDKTSTASLRKAMPGKSRWPAGPTKPAGATDPARSLTRAMSTWPHRQQRQHRQHPPHGARFVALWIAALSLGAAVQAQPAAAAPDLGPDSATAGADDRENPPRRIVSGWLPHWSMPDSMTSLRAHADLWSGASPFWYRMRDEITVVPHRGAGDTRVVEELRRLGIPVLPSVTESMDAATMAGLLRDPDRRAAQVRTLVDLVRDNGYDGVDLDYEAMNFGGTAEQKAAVRSGFPTLLRELDEALGDRELAVSVPARLRAEDRNWPVYDYPAIAPSVDRFRVMAYNKTYAGGSPGAVAPAGWVEDVIRYTVKVVPPGKVEVGVPLYGYDWPADRNAGDGWGKAQTLTTYNDAEAVRAASGARRQWSDPDGTPFFTYSRDGVDHVVWYNDAHSVSAKLGLVGRYGLRGLVFWYPGREDPTLWPAVRDYALQRRAELTATAPARLVYGPRAEVTGRLTTRDGTPVPGRRVTVWRRSAGAAGWSVLGTAETSDSGQVSMSFLPRYNGEVRLSSPGSWNLAPGSSPPVPTLVAYRVTGRYDQATVPLGTQVRLRGTAAPARPGTRVVRQRWAAGRWVTVGTAPVAADGDYLFAFGWNVRGRELFRVVAPATRANTTGYSQALALTVV